MFYLEISVIEPVILALLEEVGVSIIILKSIIDIVWNPLPVCDWPVCGKV